MQWFMRAKARKTGSRFTPFSTDRLKKAAGQSILLVAIAAVSLAAPSSATAKPGSFTVPPEQSSELTVRGTHGFRISIDRNAGEVELTASRRDTSATYAVRSAKAPADETKATFPGLGRVSLRFHPIGKPKRQPPECKGRAPIEQPGVFRGTIGFRGERGFTQVVATHARGDTYRSFKEVCKRSGFGHEKPPAAAAYSLAAIGKSHGRTILFSAFKTKLEESSASGEAMYIALTFEKRHGVSIARGALKRAPASTFTVEGPEAEPDAATVSPRSPFDGTASFHGAAGPPGEWQGTLAVDLPGAGSVPLTGPSFKSELCLNKRCVGQLGA